MSAPKSILAEMRQPFAPVDKTKVLYKKTLDACLKMPKRYTYLVLQDVIHLAGLVMDNAKAANSIRPRNQHEAQIRRDYWLNARANLQALSSRIDRFLEIPETLRYKDEISGRSKGITVSELCEIADLINEEMGLLTSTLENELQRYKNLP